mmetsp:Transcript_31463/g.30806  ORF Transcript_31463/g.30806 Transcript_31463/m.30806 type:complete len:88 (-) Transcript_31463:280-543(-)
MQEHSRFKFLEVFFDFISLLIDVAHRNSQRPLDHAPHHWKRRTIFPAKLTFFCLIQDLRVDEDVVVILEQGLLFIKLIHIEYSWLLL